MLMPALAMTTSGRPWDSMHCRPVAVMASMYAVYHGREGLELIYETPTDEFAAALITLDGDHLGHEVDRDLEDLCLVGKDQPRQMIRERILLPVDEVRGRLDLERVRQDAGAAVGRGPQAHDLGRQGHAAVVLVACDMLERDMDRQGASSRMR